MFSGGALKNFSVAAMGVYPYITASIIITLLVPVIPRLQALSMEGEAGRNRINQITHWLTVPMAGLKGYGQIVLLQARGRYLQSLRVDRHNHDYGHDSRNDVCRVAGRAYYRIRNWQWYINHNLWWHCSWIAPASRAGHSGMESSLAGLLYSTL